MPHGPAGRELRLLLFLVVLLVLVVLHCSTRCTDALMHSAYFISNSVYCVPLTGSGGRARTGDLTIMSRAL